MNYIESLSISPDPHVVIVDLGHEDDADYFKQWFEKYGYDAFRAWITEQENAAWGDWAVSKTQVSRSDQGTTANAPELSSPEPKASSECSSTNEKSVSLHAKGGC